MSSNFSKKCLKRTDRQNIQLVDGSLEKAKLQNRISAESENWKFANLSKFKITKLQNWKPAKSQNTKTSKFQNYKIAKL